MEKYRELEYHYKDFLIWGNSRINWIVEPPEPFSPDSKDQNFKIIYYKIRNEQPELKTLKQAKKWIDEIGIKLLELPE